MQRLSILDSKTNEILHVTQISCPTPDKCVGVDIAFDENMETQTAYVQNKLELM
jgi:hypothetical protein